MHNSEDKGLPSMMMKRGIADRSAERLKIPIEEEAKGMKRTIFDEDDLP
jgi:hypothetical protein